MSIVRCEACGNHFTAGPKFCVHCGQPMLTAAPASAPLTPELVRALAGRNGGYYARKLSRLFPEGHVSLKPSWNWAAALVPFWWIYRRLYAPALFFYVVALVAGAIRPGLGLLVLLAQGLTADALYLKSLERTARRQTALRTDLSFQDR
jgi:hypothetical protein